MNRISEIDTHVLVIGSGIAGLRAAIQAKKYVDDVFLVDKTLFGRQTLSSISGGTTGLVSDYWSFTHPQSVDEFTAFHVISNAFAVTGIREQWLEYVAAREIVVRQDELAEYGVENPRARACKNHFTSKLALKSHPPHHPLRVGSRARANWGWGSDGVWLSGVEELVGW